jgi:hypothetical protein
MWCVDVVCGVLLFACSPPGTPPWAVVTMILSTSSMLGIDGVVPVVEGFHDPSSYP